MGGEGGFVGVDLGSEIRGFDEEEGDVAEAVGVEEPDRELAGGDQVAHGWGRD